MLKKKNNLERNDEVRDKTKTYINPDKTEVRVYIDNEWVVFVKQEKILNKIEKLNKKLNER